jgi:hypothetical protein
VRAALALQRGREEPAAAVTLENTGKMLAFQVRLKAVDAAGKEILPVYWHDNYVSLLPGETRTIGVLWPARSTPVAAVVIEGWNVASARVTPSGAR